MYEVAIVALAVTVALITVTIDMTAAGLRFAVEAVKGTS